MVEKYNMVQYSVARVNNHIAQTIGGLSSVEIVHINAEFQLSMVNCYPDMAPGRMVTKNYRPCFGYA
jgi:hypothetical protein